MKALVAFVAKAEGDIADNALSGVPREFKVRATNAPAVARRRR